jgi:hypothetical protein
LLRPLEDGLEEYVQDLQLVQLTPRPGLHPGTHPVLDHWGQAWDALLVHPDGQACIEALNDAMPKSQVIIAAKP